MAATTDYDAPRRSTIEEAETESLEALTATRPDAQSPVVEMDEGDAAESVEVPDIDLSGEELTMPVVPKKADEFTCSAGPFAWRAVMICSSFRLARSPTVEYQGASGC